MFWLLASIVTSTALQRARERGVFQPAAVERLARTGGREPALGLQLWTVLNFEVWWRLFLDGAAKRRAA